MTTTISPMRTLSDEQRFDIAETWRAVWGLDEGDVLVGRLGYPPLVKPALTHDALIERMRIAHADRTSGPSVKLLAHPQFWLPSTFLLPGDEEAMELWCVRIWEALRLARMYDPATASVVSPLSQLGLSMTDRDDTRRVLKWLDGGAEDKQLDDLLVDLPARYSHPVKGLRVASDDVQSIWSERVGDIPPE